MNSEIDRMLIQSNSEVSNVGGLGGLRRTVADDQGGEWDGENEGSLLARCSATQTLELVKVKFRWVSI